MTASVTTNLQPDMTELLEKVRVLQQTKQIGSTVPIIGVPSRQAFKKMLLCFWTVQHCCYLGLVGHW